MIEVLWVAGYLVVAVITALAYTFFDSADITGESPVLMTYIGLLWPIFLPVGLLWLTFGLGCRCIVRWIRRDV